MGYSNKTFTCPFFRWDERLCIHCEGGRIAYPDRKTAEEYINRYCGSVVHWKECSVASNLLRYYERTEREAGAAGRTGRGRASE